MIMIENQSISKKQKMDYHPSAGDLLSDLPLSIIHTILALAPVRDAIKTSILSRQWRYTWTSLPHLVFEECSGSRKNRLRSKFEERMRNLITHVLFHHKGTIHKFRMSVSFQVFRPYIDNWVFRLSRKDVRELILDMGYSDDCNWLQLHSSIYSCEKLTFLHLFRCELDLPPSTFKGFLSLRHLCLQEVHLSSNGIESFLANSPLLEKLVLINSRISELRISAPNLKHLYLVGEYVELCLYAPLLAEMDVELTHDDFTVKYQQRKSVCNYTNFIGGFTHLEKLRGHRYFTKYLSIGIESYHHSLLFHRLNDIVLEHVNFEDIKAISVVARLIISAPNLQTLEISTNVCTGQDDALEAPRVSFRDFGCPPNFAFEKLRVVNIDGVCGLPAKITFIKFLLESSPMLEMMTLDMYGGIPNEKKLNLMDELLGFCRASPNAKLLTKLRRNQMAGTKSGARVWLFVTLTVLTSSASAVAGEGEPTPKPWPEQFHSVLVMNYSGKVEIIDLWYDWPKGRNFNIIHHQLGKVTYDLEWNNGTSFFYTLDEDKECKTLDVGFGILRPNWLAGANYLGQIEFAGFLCNVWEKVEFIWYYEDVVTRRPVHWRFYTGRSAHVMTFEVGAVLDDAEWQAPAYCFQRTADRHVRALPGGFKGAIASSIALL